MRFPGTARTFLWDCIFFENRSEEVPPLLGLYGVVDSLQLTIDRKKSPTEPYGCIVFEEYPGDTPLPIEPSAS